MKKVFLLIVMAALYLSSAAQSISGKVTDGKNALPGATVIIVENEKHTVSSGDGAFSFSNLEKGVYTLKVNYIGFETKILQFTLSDKPVVVNVVLQSEDFYTDEVVITGIRAGESTPVAFFNVEKSDIEKNNTGRDIPYILDLTPSVVIGSDAGTGVGYTSMRIRGTDITRINITMDGIPLNDSESHGVWWVNMPDFASSADMIQVQRGVGTSSNGAGAFGANVGLYTKKINTEPYAHISADYGSFNTQKYTFKAGSGLINNHFSFDTRFSRLSSDGYIDNAWADLKSMQLTATYTGKNTLVKLNFLQGEEHTYQAWYGVPKDSLLTETGRTYNPYEYENETDNYKQTHYQLFFKQDIASKLSFNAALHYTQGAGYYEQYKEGQNFSDYGIENVVIGTEIIEETDLIRQKWLDNDFFGIVYSLNYSLKDINIKLGGGANNYIGDHFGKVIWAQYASNSEINHEFYRNQGNKIDFNEYLKVSYSGIRNLNLWGDFQIRNVNYTIDGIHDDMRDISQNRTHRFFNPKAGLSYSFVDDEKIYFSFATANREPSRTDYKDASEFRLPFAETLYDYELGYNRDFKSASFNINLYYMNYKNQLVLTGEINNIGSPITTNVDKSYRAGAEFSGGFKFQFIDFKANLTLSRNKIKDFTAHIDDYDTWPVQRTETYELTNIAFSPEIISYSEINFNIFENFYFAFISKYVGEQFIDNTSNDERKLNDYLVNNIRINYSFNTKYAKEIGFHVSVNNIFSQKYETNAWVYRYYAAGEHYAADGYFPQAGINFFAGINIKF